ncbi:MAG: component of SufBCD complex [Pseudomonadota bacterium]
MRRRLNWGSPVEWYESVFEVIDLRSFSNLWYWIGLAVLWSSVSHWVLGIPHDAILRARRGTPETAMDDLHDLTRVNVNRILYIVDVSGAWLALFGSAGITALAITAFGYNVEFAQAVFFMALPMVILGGLSARTARQIRTNALQGEDLIRRLIRHRFGIQLLGVVSIFITAMYGMWVNLYTGPFGGF